MTRFTCQALAAVAALWIPAAGPLILARRLTKTTPERGSRV